MWAKQANESESEGRWWHIKLIRKSHESLGPRSSRLCLLVPSRVLAVFFKRELASDTKDQNIKTHKNKNITVVEFKLSFFLQRGCEIFGVQ